MTITTAYICKVLTFVDNGYMMFIDIHNKSNSIVYFSIMIHDLKNNKLSIRKSKYDNNLFNDDDISNFLDCNHTIDYYIHDNVHSIFYNRLVFSSTWGECFNMNAYEYLDMVKTSDVVIDYIDGVYSMKTSFDKFNEIVNHTLKYGGN